MQVKRLKNVDRFVGEHGGVIDVDRQGAFTGAWFDIQEQAADVGAEVLLNAVIETFERQGAVAEYGPWRENEPETRRWKAPETQILVGRTETLASTIYGKLEVREQVDVPGTRRGGKASTVGTMLVDKVIQGPFPRTFKARIDAPATTRFIGVFDQTRPPEYHGKSVAEMFAIHEFGTPDGHIPARPLFARAFDLAQEQTAEITERAIKTAAAQVVARLSREAQKELELLLIGTKTRKRYELGGPRSRAVEGRYDAELGERRSYMMDDRYFIRATEQRLDTSPAKLIPEMKGVIDRDVHLSRAEKTALLHDYDRAVSRMAFPRMQPLPPSKTGFKARR